MPTQLPLNEQPLLLLADENSLSRIVEQTTSEMGALMETVTHPAAATTCLESNRYGIILLSEVLIDAPYKNGYSKTAVNSPFFYSAITENLKSY